MCGNSGRREALITFFSFEKVSINIIFLLKGRPSGSKTGICFRKGFLVKHRLLDAAAR